MKIIFHKNWNPRSIQRLYNRMMHDIYMFYATFDYRNWITVFGSWHHECWDNEFYWKLMIVLKREMLTWEVGVRKLFVVCAISVLFLWIRGSHHIKHSTWCQGCKGMDVASSSWIEYRCAGWSREIRVHLQPRQSCCHINIFSVYRERNSGISITTFCVFLCVCVIHEMMGLSTQLFRFPGENGCSP